MSHPVNIQLTNNQITQGETAHRMLDSHLCRFSSQHKDLSSPSCLIVLRSNFFVPLSQRSCKNSKVLLSFQPTCYILRGESSNGCRIHLNYFLSLGSQPFKSWLSQLFSSDAINISACSFILHSFYPAFWLSIIRKTSLVRTNPS